MDEEGEMKRIGTNFDCPHCGHEAILHFVKPSVYHSTPTFHQCASCDAEYSLKISIRRGTQGKKTDIVFQQVKRHTPWWKRMRRVFLGVK